MSNFSQWERKVINIYFHRTSLCQSYMLICTVENFHIMRTEVTCPQGIGEGVGGGGGGITVKSLGTNELREEEEEEKKETITKAEFLSSKSILVIMGIQAKII